MKLRAIKPLLCIPVLYYNPKAQTQIGKEQFVSDLLNKMTLEEKIGHWADESIFQFFRYHRPSPQKERCKN